MSKKVKAIFIIFVGLVLLGVGIFTSLLLIQRMQNSNGANQSTVEVVKTNIVVVTQDLLLGDRLDAEDVKLVEIPVEFSPRDAVVNLSDAVGKIIKTDLIQGEMVLSHNLADPTNNNKDLSYILSDDHVLMAFPVGDLMSSENVVQRGDVVDIFATFWEEIKPLPATTTNTTIPVEPTQAPVTRPFTVSALQNVSVTALVVEVISDSANTPIIGGTTENNPVRTNVRSYLFALTPQDALILKHLKDIGAIFDIVLRSPTSTGKFELTPVSDEFIIEFYGLEILP